MMIQTGLIEAIAVGFARYFSELIPWILETNYLIPPIQISSEYALSLSTTQLTGIAMIILLTWTTYLVSTTASLSKTSSP